MSPLLGLAAPEKSISLHTSAAITVTPLLGPCLLAS